MKKQLFILLLFVSFSAAAQKFATPETFSQLDSIAIDKSQQVYVYVPKGSTRLNAKLKLGEAIMDEEYPLPVAKAQVQSGATYAIGFTSLPSDDYTFMFFKEKGAGNYEYAFSVWGKQLFIPGNGFVYTSGHMNTMFDQRRKYQLEADTLREIKQPFYYVGLKTKTLKNIKLYSDKQQRELLATLPPKASIEVVAAEAADDIQYFLIRTSFGLLGWWKLDNYFSEEIEGLIYAGD